MKKQIKNFSKKAKQIGTYLLQVKKDQQMKWIIRKFLEEFQWQDERGDTLREILVKNRGAIKSRYKNKYKNEYTGFLDGIFEKFVKA